MLIRCAGSCTYVGACELAQTGEAHAVHAVGACGVVNVGCG